MDPELIKSFLNTENVFAVVGASRDPEKYGHQVYRDLLNAGYKVYCVNPNADEILGNKCFPNLKVLPIKPDVVDFVVPSIITERMVKVCKKLGIMKVWMQPGSESEVAIRFCEENSMDVVYGVCIMVERKERASNNSIHAG
jgi:predicted CoA-binding protein